MTIKTAGDLRGFLADVLVGISNGTIDVAKAGAIAKVAGQINQSLAVEVSTALQLQKMGKDQPVAGTMLLRQDEGSATTPAAIVPAIAAPAKASSDTPVEYGGGTWCEQCEMRVSAETAAGCKSKFCKVKAAT